MSNRLRNNRITFRMNDEEYKTFLEKVELSKLSQNKYMIKCITGKKIIVIDGLKELLTEVKRIGANVNQITKNLNSGFLQGATEDITLIRAELKIISQSIISVLEGIK